MIVQTSRPSLTTDGQAQILRQLTFPNHIGVSSVLADIKDEPVGDRNGAKRPAKITDSLGGCARHGGLVGVANNIQCGVLGPQAAGPWVDLCRSFALRDGLQPFIVEREGVAAGITVAYPNGSPGYFDLDVQRTAPLMVDELEGLINAAVRLPQSVFVGPTPLDQEALEFHKLASSLAPKRALMVHPSLLHHPTLFSDIGRLYGFLQMNHAEACIVDKSTREIEKLACRVRYLLGDMVDFAITNGAERGLLWADQTWLSSSLGPLPLQGPPRSGRGDFLHPALP